MSIKPDHGEACKLQVTRSARQQRLAEALRANLLKRKAQLRAREAHAASHALDADRRSEGGSRGH